MQLSTRKTKSSIKSKQKTLTDIYLKKAYRWLINTWKDVQHCSLLRETQIKTTIMYHLTLVSMTIIKKSTNNKCSTISERVQFSHLVMSDSLRLHGLLHTRPPCPSPIPEACSNSCPLSRWCHPTISSSGVHLSSCLQCFPASGSFLMSQFFSSSGQSIGISASVSVLPMNIQDWFPLGWTGWISLQSRRLSRVFSNTTVQKYQFFNAQLSL